MTVPVPSPADHAAAIREHGMCPNDQRCTPPIPESSDCAGCLAAEEHLAALVAQAETARDIVERFHEAWWNFDGSDDALDAAASDAMEFLGTVIRLPGGDSR